MTEHETAAAPADGAGTDAASEMATEPTEYTASRDEDDAPDLA